MNAGNKKVALLLPDLIAGGAQRVLLNLSKGFLNSGFDVDLLLLTGKGEFFSLVPHDVKLVRLYSKRSPSIFFSILAGGYRLLRYVKKEKPDIILSSLTKTNLYLCLLNIIFKLRVPIIIREANTLDNINGVLIKKLIKYIYPTASKIVCVSQGVKNDLLSLGILSDKLEVINNPIDYQYIVEQSNVPSTHPWITNKTYPLVLAIGRLSTQKGFDNLIRAFALVRKQIPAKLIILGEGPLHKQLSDLICELDLQENVDLAGYIDNPYSYLSNTDLFVLSSNWEGFVNVLLEAMAMGVPVVSTDCRSSPAEILKNGEIGSLVPVNNSEALANAIIQGLETPQNTFALISRAKEFTIGKICQKYIDLF